MFIRLKRVKLADIQFEKQRYSIHCVIVESYRIKGKPPRQRVIKYLGSIREQDLSNPLKRKLFISFIENRIDELSLGIQLATQLKIDLIRKIVRYGRPVR